MSETLSNKNSVGGGSGWEGLKEVPFRGGEGLIKNEVERRYATYQEPK